MSHSLLATQPPPDSVPAPPTATPPRPVTPHAIIARALADLVVLAEAEPSLGDEFRRQLDRVSKLANGLEDYLAASTTEESGDLAVLADRTRRADWDQLFADGHTGAHLEQEMLSGHIEGAFLKTLIRATRATRVLEIGLFTGYSALAIAEALPDDGRLVACEIDPFVAGFARESFDTAKHGHKIRVDLGPADVTVRALAAAGETFDFVFIDANKDGYLGYLDLLIEGALLEPGGLICVDNTLLQGQPYLESESTPNGRAIAAFNAALARDSRFTQVLLPIRDGVTLIQRA